MKILYFFPQRAVLLSAFVLGLYAGPVLAADPAALAVLKQIRTPDVKNSELSILAGSWKGRGTIRPSRRFSEMKVKCKLDNRWILGGKILKQTMRCKSFLMSVNRTTYMGFDKSSGQIIGSSYGNFGPNNASIRGKASNGSFNLVMVHAKSNGSGTVQNRLRTNLSGANTMYSVMSKISRRPYDVMRIEYRRTGGKTYL